MSSSRTSPVHRLEPDYQRIADVARNKTTFNLLKIKKLLPHKKLLEKRSFFA